MMENSATQAFLLQFQIWTYNKSLRKIGTFNIPIKFVGLPFLFAMMPELLSKALFPKLCLLIYFSMIVSWCFCGTISIVSSLVIAIMEEQPKLMKFKGSVCGILCVFACTIHVLMLQASNQAVIITWMADAVIQIKVIMFHCMLIAIFLYGLNRISNDYHFVFHRKIHPFWIHGVKVAMLVVTVGTVL